MMDLWNSLTGMVEVSITSAAPDAALRAITEKNIPIYQVKQISELTLSFRIHRKDYKILSALCDKRGETISRSRLWGIFWVLRSLVARPVLIVGIGLLLLLVLYLPSRVLFVQIEGNSIVSGNKIREAAQTAGICFGASRKDVRSEKMKNALLAELPQLQWAGINTFGCVAVISVRERTLPQPKPEGNQVSSIIAAEDGLVYSCTATRGTLLCSAGDMVRKGQILISGYTDCGLCIQATAAEGEIYARTNRRIEAVMPSEWTQKGEKTGSDKKISILLGKKRINLWKDSGNWDTSCGRIYKEYYITLPGGFQLPLGFSVESMACYETVMAEYPQPDAQRLLTEEARRDILSQTVAGSILTEAASVRKETGVYLLEGSYVCTEMIGRVQREQIGENYGKND